MLHNDIFNIFLFLNFFRAQVQDLQKREFYDLPEHGAATTKARCGLGTVQTSWARRAIKIMAVDSCVCMSMGSRENKQNKVITQLWDTL